MAKQDIPTDDSWYKQRTEMTSVELDAIPEFYARVPEETQEQLLKAILDKTFLKSLTGGNDTTYQVDNDDSKGAAWSTYGPFAQDFADYEAFLATQMDTSQGTYELFREDYKNPARQFSNVKITGNVLKSKFQVTTAPCLGNKNIDKIILHKDDWGDTPASRQKTCEKVVRAIKSEINTCKISCIFTSINKGN